MFSPLRSRSQRGTTTRHAEPLERRDCPAAFTLTAITSTVTEGNAAEFRLTMAARSTIPQAVVVSTEAITATLGTDYMHRTQKITFFPGETQKSIFVQSLVDPVNVTERSETLRLIVAPVGGTPAQLTAIVTINDYVPPDPYTIEFSFDSSVPANVQAMFQAAADRWQNVIVGDLPNVTLPNGQVVDDLLINVSVSSTLPTGVIAQAGFTDIRVGNSSTPANGNFSQNGLPYIGDMEISDDFLTAVGLPNTIAHEMGHVIGFGTLWQSNVGTFSSLVSGIGTSNPVYVGANAVREYNSIFATSGTSVPLYQVSSTTPPSYDGSYGSHWRDSVFDSTNPAYDELMTATYNVNGVNGVAVPAYLSRITVGALNDFGYTVSYVGAESYTAPASATTQTIVPAASTLPASVAASPGASLIGPLRDTLSQATRRLPPRITFADRAPLILSDTDASRELVRESFAALGGGQGSGLLDLASLDASRRQTLLAWATYAVPEITALTMPGSGGGSTTQPRIAPGVFGSIVRVSS
jgi:hypothetical protein